MKDSPFILIFPSGALPLLYRIGGALPRGESAGRRPFRLRRNRRAAPVGTVLRTVRPAAGAGGGLRPPPLRRPRPLSANPSPFPPLQILPRNPRPLSASPSPSPSPQIPAEDGPAGRSGAAGAGGRRPPSGAKAPLPCGRNERSASAFPSALTWEKERPRKRTPLSQERKH